jgi:hypothetical protein
MTTSFPDDTDEAQQRLFAIAKCWRMPLEALPGDDVHTLAERLSLAIEHQIALQLLHLEEIATLNVEEDIS